MSQITVELPRLYPAQHAAIFAPQRYSIIEASTKAGKTMGCIVWQMAQCMEREGNHWWVAPVYTQARIAYERAKSYLPRELYTANETRLELTLLNGSVWVFRSAEKPDNLYGDDVLSAVVDEASRMREAAFIALRSTLTATQGPVRIIGNVKGRGNWFYRVARKAQSGAKGYSYHKLTALDAVAAGVFPRSEYDDAKDALPEHVFRELYMAEPSDDGGNPFGLQAIDDCVGAMSTRPPLVWGWDLAKAVDWTVGIGLDDEGNVCRFERWQKTPWGVTKARILAATSDAFALVDSSGLGDPVLEDMQSDGLRAEGFKFSSSSKQQLMEGLAAAIQQGRMRIPAGPIVSELETFEYEYTRTGARYSAPAGLHDDCVCALALAWRAWERSQRARPRLSASMGGGARL
jgi:hypothetical protein